MKVRDLRRILSEFTPDTEVFFEFDNSDQLSKQSFNVLKAETVYKHPARNKKNALVIGQRRTASPLWVPWSDK